MRTRLFVRFSSVVFVTTILSTLILSVDAQANKKCKAAKTIGDCESYCDTDRSYKKCEKRVSEPATTVVESVVCKRDGKTYKGDGAKAHKGHKPCTSKQKLVGHKCVAKEPVVPTCKNWEHLVGGKCVKHPNSYFCDRMRRWYAKGEGPKHQSAYTDHSRCKANQVLKGHDCVAKKPDPPVTEPDPTPVSEPDPTPEETPEPDPTPEPNITGKEVPAGLLTCETAVPTLAQGKDKKGNFYCHCPDHPEQRIDVATMSWVCPKLKQHDESTSSIGFYTVWSARLGWLLGLLLGLFAAFMWWKHKGKEELESDTSARLEGKFVSHEHFGPTLELQHAIGVQSATSEVATSLRADLSQAETDKRVAEEALPDAEDAVDDAEDAASKKAAEDRLGALQDQAAGADKVIEVMTPHVEDIENRADAADRRVADLQAEQEDSDS